MSDYPGEIVTIRVVDPVDENGDPLDDTNANATISVYSADLTSTYVNNQAMTWDPVAGKFSFAWQTIAGTHDPGEYLAKLTVTPTGGTAGVEYKVLELAAPPTIAPWDRLVCSRWLNLGDFTLCSPDDFPPGVFDMVVDGSTDMLYSASGRQYPGVCEDTVRPEASCVTLVPMTDGGWWRGHPASGSSFLGGCVAAIELPGYPIVSVDSVKVDGTDLPPDGWVIIDDRWVARKDGVSWPSVQRLDRLDSEPDTWSVTYTWGAAPPAAGLLALQTFVCELGKGWRNDSSCRLPKRLTSITREGFSAVVLDPFKFLDEGKFGVYEIDAFVNAVNPAHLTRDAKVLNPDLLAGMARRVR